MLLAAATAADTEAMVALLQTAALPARCIEEHLEHFLVLRDGTVVRGCGGLEIYADSCLLRSLVVEPEYRRAGWGRVLARQLLARARSLGMREMIALSSTAVPFLRGLGFVEIERERISAVVRGSWQFAEDGCSCATSLRLAL